MAEYSERAMTPEEVRECKTEEQFCRNYLTALAKLLDRDVWAVPGELAWFARWKRTKHPHIAEIGRALEDWDDEDGAALKGEKNGKRS